MPEKLTEGAAFLSMHVLCGAGFYGNHKELGCQQPIVDEDAGWTYRPGDGSITYLCKDCGDKLK